MLRKTANYYRETSWCSPNIVLHQYVSWWLTILLNASTAKILKVKCLHSQLKEKSYHSSVYFWPYMLLTSRYQPFWPIKTLFTCRFGGARRLLTCKHAEPWVHDDCLTLEAYSDIERWLANHRFIFLAVGLIWLYLIRLSDYEKRDKFSTM